MFYVLFLFIAHATLDKEPPYHHGKSLNYKGTMQESMSKWQRINYIEDYLSKMKGHVDRLNQTQDKKVSQDIASVKSTLQTIENQLSKLDERVSALEKELNITKEKK